MSTGDATAGGKRKRGKEMKEMEEMKEGQVNTKEKAPPEEKRLSTFRPKPNQDVVVCFM